MAEYSPAALGSTVTAASPRVKPIAAIVGRPNVGKSTLFNRLVGERLAIIEDVPGTTRDRIYADVEWRGREFTLVDTGGLDLTPESQVVAHVAGQVRTAIAEADLIILLLDALDGVTAADEEIADLVRRSGKPVLPVVNKTESPRVRERAPEFYELGLGDLISVSASQGQGTGDLLDAVLERLPQAPPEPEEEEELFKIAIVGRPNVGKSQLLNRLLGEERAIVSEVPGTTRDALDTILNYRDEQIVLIDTAGIRRRGRIERGIEQYSVLRSMRAIQRADLALLMLDAPDLVTAQDLHIAGYIADEGKGCVILVNKWDLVQKDAHTTEAFTERLQVEFNFMSWAPVLFISALTGQRVHRVLEEALAVAGERDRRIATGPLNDLLQRALQRHAPPAHRGRVLKFFYVTQVTVRPPTFVFFVNDPALVHFAYRRYLDNTLRDAYGFRGTAMRLHFRARGRVELERRRRR